MAILTLFLNWRVGMAMSFATTHYAIDLPKVLNNANATPGDHTFYNPDPLQFERFETQKKERALSGNPLFDVIRMF